MNTARCPTADDAVAQTPVWWSAVQRAVALLMLLAAAPLLAVLYVMVKRGSPGPFIFRQLRPGYRGTPFYVLKIRTMAEGADRTISNGLVVAKSNPQVTRLGRVLRELKLDELPQLWNIVRGQMEFVGARPIAPVLHDMLCREIPGFERRLLVRPGLTALGQVSIHENAEGARLVEDWRQRFEAEAHYLAHKSPAYDMVIIVMTVLYVGRKLLRRAGVPKVTMPQRRLA